MQTRSKTNKRRRSSFDDDGITSSKCISKAIDLSGNVPVAVAFSKISNTEV